MSDRGSLCPSSMLFPLFARKYADRLERRPSPDGRQDGRVQRLGHAGRIPNSVGGGIVAEHMAVRTGVGIFDVSHMGDIRLAGPQALAAVQHISMNDASRLAIGQAQYSALLYPQGTFVDDVIVHRLGEDEYLLVINAGTREKDFNWVRDNTRQFDCEVENLSDDFTQIAIQGPNGVNVLQKLTDADLSAVKFYWFTRGTVCGLKNILMAPHRLHRRRRLRDLHSRRRGDQRARLARNSRRGQRIRRCPLRTGRAQHAASRRRAAPLRPRNFRHDQCLGSRTGSFLQDGKGDFIGRAALEKAKAEGVKRTLVGLEMIDRGIARDGYKVFDRRRHARSAMSPAARPRRFLKKNIALAYVPLAQAAVGTTVKVEIRGQGVKVQGDSDAVLQASEEAVALPSRRLSSTRRAEAKTAGKTPMLQTRARSKWHIRPIANTPKNMSGSSRRQTARSASPTMPRSRSATSCSSNCPRWARRSQPARPSARSNR